MTEGHDDIEPRTGPEDERQVIITGKPILIVGALAFFSLRWLRRRKRRRASAE